MEFRTEIKLNKYPFQIDYNHKILFIGSCFAENIGKYFKNNYFNVKINPFGVLYNPISIKNGLSRLINKDIMKEDELFFYNDLWNSFFHHSSFSNNDKQVCLANINKNIEDYYYFLKEIDFLFITFGSAYVYENKTNKEIVSNCHKIPEKEFNQYLLDFNSLTNYYSNFISKLIEFNPNLKIILTVSPIRYLKYGFEKNTISKSILILLANFLTNKYNFIYYFPSYEIINDDLRDYRFYNKDMIHPNEIAVDYICEKILDTFFNNKTKDLAKEIKKIYTASKHKPYNISSKKHQEFLLNNLEKINIIMNNYPNIYLNDLKEIFLEQLI
ncbi:MAG: GSCFA domain-containing protein [Candidatus Sericytochromatia bacterium]